VNHFAFSTRTVKGKPVVDYVQGGFKARGDADKASLTFVSRYGSGHAVSIEGELKAGDPVPADEFRKRR
jgi:hypothetical protein